MNIIYKRLEPQQSPEYRKIRLKSLREHPESFGSTYEEEEAKEKLYFEKCIETENADDFVIGAFHNEKLIGLCAIFRSKGQKTKHRADLIQVYVMPEYRNNNIASGLLSFAIAEVKKISEIEQLELGVSTQNPAAIAVYEKAGFKVTGTNLKCLKIENKYIDELLMVLFLN